jgi:hypothetical protein
MIEIQPDFFVQPCHIVAVKKIDNDKCTVYLTGQSALEGFTVERSAVELADEVDEALEEDD